LRTKEEIEVLEAAHAEAPHLRVLQKAIAEDITTRVHGAAALQTAIAASNILFGKSTAADLRLLSEKDFFAVFEGVPQATISAADFGTGMSIIDALAAKTGFLSSNGEARRELKANAIAVNKDKVGEDFIITADELINGRYALLGKGKKNNYILIIE
jgi:tyrosyl-tRNA synthetase